MSKNTAEIILAKLTKLALYLRYLKSLKLYSRKRFLSDFVIVGATERYLQLAIEILIDVGRLLCAEYKLPRPDNAHEVFEVLLKHKLISRALYARLIGIAGFRNILVHDYMKVDHEIVYKNLQDRLEDFSLFSNAIRKLVRNKS